jgi:hypothetical protein
MNAAVGTPAAASALPSPKNPPFTGLITAIAPLAQALETHRASRSRGLESRERQHPLVPARRLVILERSIIGPFAGAQVLYGQCAATAF